MNIANNQSVKAKEIAPHRPMNQANDAAVNNADMTDIEKNRSISLLTDGA
jgi:hypothetical protein